MSSNIPPTSTSQSQTAQPQAVSFAVPNLYQLAGGGVHVSYRTQGFRAPFFTYHDAHHTLSFSGDQVRHVEVPDLGTVVSVTLMLTVDAGSTTFSVVLPHVNLPNHVGASAPVHTEGITTVHRLSIVPQFDLGQRDFYTIVPLSGTASLAIVPL
jgi:hypothetical protein